MADRRNGSYRFHVLTELGDLELAVPRTLRFSPVRVLTAYPRRAPEVERMILAALVPGLSTRKVSEALLPILGEPVSPATVGRIAKTLKGGGAGLASPLAVGRLPRADVRWSRGRAQGRSRSAAPARAGGLGHQARWQEGGPRFRQAPGESQAAWQAFLNGLHQRGRTGARAELAVRAGGKGLLAALPLVFAPLPVQRCWAHKRYNVLNWCRQADHAAVKPDLHRVMHAPGFHAARSAAARCSTR
ncbi:MAG TPA: transposase, partial [bacterium]|nr:transposase [bacterium]